MRDLKSIVKTNKLKIKLLKKKERMVKVIYLKMQVA